MAGKVLAVLLPLLLCLSGLAGLLLLCIPTRDVREPPAYKYGIVLDAGSSHTSMFVYKWPADKENDTGIVSQHSMCDVHGGGISSYAEDPPGAGRSLVSCLNQAMKDVPKERHSVTPLYLGATAGMRLLNLTSPAASDSVLSSVTETLTQYPFDFRGARILSGQDEGVFGWVTANYLLENFIKYGWVGEWIRPRQGTVGAMDLGGASTQITFETASQAEDPANEVKLQLYGQSYRVYTHSFLCYGRDQILKRLLAGVLQAFSAFYYTVDFLRKVMKLPVTSPGELRIAAKALCNESWVKLLERAPGQQARLADYCACATFVNQLLLQGYKFDEHTFPSIAFQKKAGDTSIGWALGYMLNLTNMIPPDQRNFRKGTDYGSWVVLILLFIVVILVALAMLFCFARSSKSQSAI
ncbi:ectonucleoside triphosphate diphosphohydrolase 2 isoform X3 [Phascolarctos cinereus]|uniref:Ectonucleoside triphosphate diphosphohydrolase 2 isoform X3 n=1 Tax=Phascolarctos cinereus TaxID=38626 RepID=A0A6P5JTB0_PHACI|nr:ectonucleoside triphosphate diphosphohydrolase 2 isoform X3 [Phascolarctos cinereus]